MLNRDNVINQAFHDCLKEMFAKAQPSVDYDQLISDFKEGKITEGPKNHIYDRYYLSQEEFSYILDKYVDAYKIASDWPNHFELLENYLHEGGSKDVYKPDWTDTEGNWHPGHRDYEKVPSIEKQFRDYFKKVLGENYQDNEVFTKDLSDMVYETVQNCKNFYSFTREESSFRGGIALGCSPTSNKQTVIDYWKSQGVDITITDKNPLLLWEYDYYGDGMDEAMRDEYGDNWEEYWWNKYHVQEQKKAEERKKWFEKWKKVNCEDNLAQNLLDIDEEK